MTFKEWKEKHNKFDVPEKERIRSIVLSHSYVKKPELFILTLVSTFVTVAFNHLSYHLGLANLIARYALSFLEFSGSFPAPSDIFIEIQLKTETADSNSCIKMRNLLNSPISQTVST